MTKDLDDALETMRAALARADGAARADAASGTKVLYGASEVDLGGKHGWVEVEYYVTAKYSFDFEVKSIKSVDWGDIDKAARAGLQSAVERKVQARVRANQSDWIEELTSKL